MSSIFDMKYSWVKNVCVIDSMHAFLQYLLLVPESESNNTFYFWGEGISPAVKSAYEGHYMTFDKKRKYGWFEILSEYPFLLKNNIHYWGQDHLPISKYIIRRHDFELLEDGTLNYTQYPWRYRKTLKRTIFALWEGPLCCLDIPYSGYEKNCSKINLTGLVDTGEVYSSNKLSVKSFQSLWDESDDVKKAYINRVFGVDEEFCSQLRQRKKILLTQPFSEDGFLTEDEKISIYSKVIEVIGGDDVVIKRHPREKTDYKKFFPNVSVFDLAIPMQLIMLNGIRFEEAYTIFSSAVFGFSYKIRIGFIGSQISHKLLKKFPNHTRDSYQGNGGNAEMIDLRLEGVCD